MRRRETARKSVRGPGENASRARTHFSLFCEEAAIVSVHAGLSLASRSLFSLVSCHTQENVLVITYLPDYHTHKPSRKREKQSGNKHNIKLFFKVFIFQLVEVA
jgi:hypothetical protein